MVNDKIRQEVYQYLPELLKYVKSKAVAAEMGKSEQWFTSRINRQKNGKYSIRQFRPEDMELLNKAIGRIANRLLTVTINYSDDRQEVIDEIRSKLNELFIKSIVVYKMGWTDSKLRVTMANSTNKGHILSFTASDVQQITLAVREIAMRMLSVEYYLDQE